MLNSIALQKTRSLGGGDKSLQQVPSCDKKSSRRDQKMFHKFQPVCIYGTSPCHLFLKLLPVNCLWKKSLQPVPLQKLNRGLVAEASLPSNLALVNKQSSKKALPETGSAITKLLKGAF